MPDTTRIPVIDDRGREYTAEVPTELYRAAKQIEDWMRRHDCKVFQGLKLAYP